MPTIKAKRFRQFVQTQQLVLESVASDQPVKMVADVMTYGHDEIDYGDLHCIADNDVLQRLNVFVGSIFNSLQTNPLAALTLMRNKLLRIGLQFELPTLQDKDDQKLILPLTLFGGIFDPLTGNTSDGITDRTADKSTICLHLDIKQAENNQYSIKAKIIRVEASKIDEGKTFAKKAKNAIINALGKSAKELKADNGKSFTESTVSPIEVIEIVYEDAKDPTESIHDAMVKLGFIALNNTFRSGADRMYYAYDGEAIGVNRVKVSGYDSGNQTTFITIFGVAEKEYNSMEFKNWKGKQSPEPAPESGSKVETVKPIEKIEDVTPTVGLITKPTKTDAASTIK